MENKLGAILQSNKHEPTTGLSDKIWYSIVEREKRIARIKLLIFSLVGIGSLVGIIPALGELSGDLLRSGFYEYFSLVFSGGSSLLYYWKELALSIAESLPIMSTLLSLSLLFSLFLSMRYVARQIFRNQMAFTRLTA